MAALPKPTKDGISTISKSKMETPTRSSSCILDWTSLHREQCQNSHCDTWRISSRRNTHYRRQKSPPTNTIIRSHGEERNSAKSNLITVQADQRSIAIRKWRNQQASMVMQCTPHIGETEKQHKDKTIKGGISDSDCTFDERQKVIPILKTGISIKKRNMEHSSIVIFIIIYGQSHSSSQRKPDPPSYFKIKYNSSAKDKRHPGGS